MKIAIITDTHFGAKNDDPIFLEAYLSYFEEQVFPYLTKKGIKTVIHMGDVLDRRKYINFNTLHNVRRRFTEWFSKNGVEVHCVIGNHDCYWKNTNQVNSVVEIFGDTCQMEQSTKLGTSKVHYFVYVYIYISFEKTKLKLTNIFRLEGFEILGHMSLNRRPGY
jgi:predicted phosphodiesterase